MTINELEIVDWDHLNFLWLLIKTRTFRFFHFQEDIFLSLLMFLAPIYRWGCRAEATDINISYRYIQWLGEKNNGTKYFLLIKLKMLYFFLGFCLWPWLAFVWFNGYNFRQKTNFNCPKLTAVLQHFTDQTNHRTLPANWRHFRRY